VSSATYDEILAERPVLAADHPFVAVVDALTDATIAVAKLHDLVTDDDRDLRDEFPLRTEDEQTGFGIKVAVGAMTITALVQSISGAVGQVFLDFDGESQ
jgi:hypothetical protein